MPISGSASPRLHRELPGLNFVRPFPLAQARYNFITGFTPAGLFGHLISMPSIGVGQSGPHIHSPWADRTSPRCETLSKDFDGWLDVSRSDLRGAALLYRLRQFLGNRKFAQAAPRLRAIRFQSVSRNAVISTAPDPFGVNEKIISRYPEAAPKIIRYRDQ